jgi:pyruvate carboxylase
MPEFTGSMKITIEVTIKAKNRKEAESFFDDIYLNASIETNEHSEVKILRDNTGYIENNWEIED